MSIFTGQINVNEALSFINTDILSNIKEGLVLTKDYALELGGRYIQYSIATNIIYAILCLIGFVTILCLLKRFARWAKENTDDSEGVSRAGFFMGGIVPIIVLFFLGLHYITNTIKRYFVPEIQMYQVIMDIKNSQTTSE